ncbi:hypothetical protein DPMN_023757 [Dreissena polymorpha]|uniref:Uncharacterized protein n=1 Tax=Dreissena polymorpha TaxID=45954 RepID=A0A9D4RA74_DREPO|nr:hypothetical protein DPMN_023757 [Dreissena polymorpha]
MGSLLHVAVQVGDCNIRDINGDTPTCDVHVRLVWDCNIGDSNGGTPLHAAVQLGLVGDCNIRDINGDTPTCDVQVGLVGD